VQSIHRGFHLGLQLKANALALPLVVMGRRTMFLGSAARHSMRRWNGFRWG
jgi:hypothetical protein